MSSQQSTFKFHNVADILRLPDPVWIIDGILVKNSFAVLFGPPGVGKSFLALSWAFAVAAEKPWQEKKVNGGPVVYVAAEGSGGLKLRIKALQSHDKYSRDTPCWFVTEPVNFVSPDKVRAFIAEIEKTVGKPALIIVDTLARCFVGGDENSAKEMGLFIDGIETVRRESGATVLVVHHTGKNESSGARGSSALMGAADTMIECSGYQRTMTVQCEKQKDAEEFAEMTFELSKVDLGYGKSSCVLEPTDPLKQFVSLEDDPTVKKMLAILEDDFGSDGAKATQWQKACEEAKITRETFYRRRTELLSANSITKDGDGQGARYRLVKSEPVSVSD